MVEPPGFALPDTFLILILNNNIEGVNVKNWKSKDDVFTFITLPIFDAGINTITSRSIA